MYSFISVVYVTKILQRGILINRMNVCLDMSMGMCTKEIQNRRITKKDLEINYSLQIVLKHIRNRKCCSFKLTIFLFMSAL